MTLDLKRTVSQKNKKESLGKKKLSKNKKTFLLIVAIFSILLPVFPILYILNLQTNLANKNSVIKQQAESEKRKYEEIQELKKDLEEQKKINKEDLNKDDVQKEILPEKVDIDKSLLSLIVLNGNGVYDAAKNFSIKLKGMGYSKLIRVADADNYKYFGITINYPAGKKTEAEKLKSDLENEYIVNLKELDNTTKTDITIIVGK